MSILAENRFTITKKLFFEGMLRVSAENYGKFAKKAVAFLGLAWLALAVVTLCLRQSLGYVGIELVVLCLAALWIIVFMPRYKAKKAFHTLKDRCDNNLERITRFYQDRLEVEAAGCQTVVLYSEIRQILRTKHLLVLVTEDGTGILLTLDGFTCGGEAAVLEGIRNARTAADEPN